MMFSEVNRVHKARGVAALGLMLLFPVTFGCAHLTSPTNQIPGPAGQTSALSIYSEYAPVKIDILPLTEFNVNKETSQDEINLYVSLLDSFGSQIKSPCIFRFELYLKVERSSEPKGRRVMLWPDVDLKDLKINSEYWQNFLRAYEFHLPFEPQAEQPYILEVTCICLNSRRISSEFELKTSE
ncbi:MAG: hypothetical protein P8016_10575 [Sedimentisphaerales bacterium]